MSKDELDGEWLEALEIEDDAPKEPEEVNEEVEENDSDDGSPEDDKGTDEDVKEDEPAEEPKDDNADDEPEADEPTEKAEEEPEPEPEPVNETKEAIKEALAEIEASKTDRSTRIDTYRDEAAKALYPEGIDRQLRDSDGDPITGIEDLTKLINPKTQDYFTDEEAGSYLLQGQQKLNKDVEAVEKFIDQVAETNAEIEDGALRVVEKYGKVLENDLELRDRLLKGYDKTLVKDPKTGVTIKAPIEVGEFFDMALEPMLKQQNAEAEAAAKASKEAEAAAKVKASKDTQSDRGDLKPSGKAEQLAPEDEEWAEAEKSYQQGDTR